MTGRPVILACSVFKEMLDPCLTDQSIPADVEYLDSMLHMKPCLLEERLTERTRYHQGKGRPVVLLYGDCHPGMAELDQQAGVIRVSGVNCVQILTGRPRYRELRRNRSFVVLPEWALRWREVMARELGLNDQIMRAFMQDHHDALVYLDTGEMPIPADHMQAFSDACNLPWRVENLDPTELLAGIQEALAQVN